jgi:hypothetical protein
MKNRPWTISTKHLQIFAEMVAAEEREACARIAEHLKEYFPTDDVAPHLLSWAIKGTNMGEVEQGSCRMV